MSEQAEVQLISMDEHSEGPEEPSKAVVASDGNGHGCVVWFVGTHLHAEIKECGLHYLDDLGLDDAPQGISVWEGKYHWSAGGYEHPDEGEVYPKGAFRDPTDEEWLAIRAGSNPWRKVEPAPAAAEGVAL